MLRLFFLQDYILSSIYGRFGRNKFFDASAMPFSTSEYESSIADLKN